ncbi:MAG TPA: HdeA/HdeB family chaperone [Xanthobacteraceae bacterium]|nr:HdeA/HdeB family chaperone [Xanthobacteraceae bacterium]
MMRCRVALVLAALAVQALGFAAPAQAQDEEIPCDAFVKNPDGSWSATRAVFLLGPNFSVRAGGVFRHGEKFKDYDLAAKLDDVCRNAAAVPPGALPPPSALPQGAAVPARPPQLSLSSFADANGNIDVARLACGHLADASSEEAELLIAWFAGAQAGAAKRRAINLASLRYVTGNIVAYCRANRDKRLITTLEFMLK